MNRTIFFLLCFLILFLNKANSQNTHAHNGYWLPVQDTLRILLIYAELDNYDGDLRGNPNWPKGQLPSNPDVYLSPFADTTENAGFLTRYFYQASFGNYFVLGDYIDTIVTLDYSKGQTRDDDVIRFLQNLPGDDIITANGFSLNSNAFDKITATDRNVKGIQKEFAPDGMIDLAMIIWRKNPTISRSDNSGSISLWARKLPLKEMKGFVSMSRFVSSRNNGLRIIRHEFAHALVGGNNFHTQGGAGNRKVLPIPGGYGILSSHASISGSFNAYDRYRLGWVNEAEHSSPVSGLNPENRTSVNTDFTLDNYPEQDTIEILLRDFVTYGDALRIELPHLQKVDSTVDRQFLWLENRQIVDRVVDHGGSSSKGIYAYLQIGKENLKTFDEANNYIWFLNAKGNFDIDFQNEESILSIDTWKQNPLTGYNMSKEYALPQEGMNVIRGEDHFLAQKVYIDGTEVDESKFRYRQYTIFGNDWDTFQNGRVISMGSNPSSSPILTYEMPRRGLPRNTARTFDNRHIHLNGIKVEVKDVIENNQSKGSEVLIRIIFNNTFLNENVRWCGPILLHDSLIAHNFDRISLERGFTPTRPVEPDSFNYQKVFSSPTFLQLTEDAYCAFKDDSRLHIRDDSEFIISEHSSAEVQDYAKIIIEDNAKMIIRGNITFGKFSEVLVKNNGKLIIEPSAEVILQPGAIWSFEDNGKIETN